MLELELQEVPKMREREIRRLSITKLQRLQFIAEDELSRREWKEHEKRLAKEAERAARTVVRTKRIHQLVRCGKVGCKCASGELHGPYWYELRTMANGKTRKRYIGKTLPKEGEQRRRSVPSGRPASRAPRRAR